MSATDEDGARAIVFANTRRKRRTQDLITVAEAFDLLAGLYGSSQAVAGKVGLSAEIVREFRCLLRLSEPVRELVRQRRIDRLDAAYRLAMIEDPVAQLEAARQAAGLTTDEIRDVRQLLHREGLSVADATVRVRESRLGTLHVFLIEVRDADYERIARLARGQGLEAAELVRDVVVGFLARAGTKGAGEGGTAES